MATKTIVLSDLSGVELADENHARVVVDDHPALVGPVELDVATEEAGKLQTVKLDLVHLTVYEPNVPPRRVVMEAKALQILFKDVDMEEVLGTARKVEQAAKGRARKSRSAPAKSGLSPKAEKVNYATPEHAGMLHRGRITEEEKVLVREDPDRASKNREAQTGSPIDFTDPAEIKRYGL